MKSPKTILLSFFILAVLFPIFSFAQEIMQDEMTIEKAKVLEIISETTQLLPGSDVPTPVQEIRVEILSGEKKGETIKFKNDYVILEEGDVFYLSHTKEADGGREFWNVYEPNRMPILIILGIIFFVLVVLVGGLPGLRGILSLAGSLFAIIFLLLPGILEGYSPLLVAIGVSSLIIIVGSYITHGFNKTTSSAVFGMIFTVVFTGFLAFYAVHHSKLTGMGDEESLFLVLNTRGQIDLLGVLMGGIMIGLLGVLYDVAIGQSIAVEELHGIAPHVSRFEIYKRALRIGREHIGALVDTLAIAYVGASLPLLLLFYSGSSVTWDIILNREIFATEIIRILVGSIGLVLAVPITTFIAVYMLVKNSPKESLSKSLIEKEKNALEHFESTHH